MIDRGTETIGAHYKLHVWIKEKYRRRERRGVTGERGRVAGEQRRGEKEQEGGLEERRRGDEERGEERGEERRGVHMREEMRRGGEAGRWISREREQ